MAEDAHAMGLYSNNASAEMAKKASTQSNVVMVQKQISASSMSGNKYAGGGSSGGGGAKTGSG